MGREVRRVFLGGRGGGLGGCFLSLVREER